MKPSSPHLDRALLARLGVIALGIGLLGLGAGAVLLPEWSAQTYGVPTAETTWVRATGVRDLILGLMTLALRPHPAALRRFLPLTLLLPLGDLVLVLLAGHPLSATAPHALGVVGIAVVVGLNATSRPPDQG